MLCSLHKLFGYRISATDGEIGKVYNFLFDDHLWRVRYLEVETGSWLSSRRVLIAPASLGLPDHRDRLFPVYLSREQIRHSPPVDTAMPVSRQQEISMSAYYSWPTYWTTEMPAPLGPLPPPAAEERVEGDPHLRSSREVMGYHIHAADGELGHVDDILCDDREWPVRYLVIDTRNWLKGRKVLLSPTWIERISWSRQEVVVNLLRDVISRAPEYTGPESVTADYEVQLFGHYGRQGYWE